MLLATACSSHDAADQHITTKQAKVDKAAHQATSRSTLTQASSVSTGDTGKTIKVKQLPGSNTNWTDWLTGNNNPAGDQGTQVQKPAIPQQSPVSQQTMAPGTSTNTQTNNDSSQFVQQVLNLVNQERTKAGLNTLSLDAELSKMAMAKAQDMYNNNYFDHQSPTYGSPFDMMKQFGITFNSAGENIAKGQQSAEEVMNQWMNSPGHRANILNSSYTNIGIAYYNSEWVQEFTG